MKQKRNHFGGYIVVFLIMVIISLVVFVWGLSSYEKPEEAQNISVQEQEKEPVPDLETEMKTEADQTEEADVEDSAKDSVKDDTEESKEDTTAESAAENEEETAAETEEETKEESQETEEIAENMPEPEAESFGRRMYQQLNDEEKGIYKIIQQTLQNMEDTCTIERVMGSVDQMTDTLLRAIDAVYFDYPEYFWFNHASQWKYWLYEDYAKVELTLDSYDYWEYVLDKKGYIDAVEQKAQEIAAAAEQFEDVYDKVKFVHDYLVTYAVYDYTAYEERTQTVQKASSQQAHTVYGCLVNQLSVCDGYAKTFQLIMNLLGIDCEYVEGDAGELHAWNYILLDGEHYWMDVTWDDYNRRDENGNLMYPNGVDYGYFCITSDTLYNTHTPEATFELPQCDATDYNFFYRENSYLEEYTFEAFAKGVEEQKDSQIISIKFGSKSAMDMAVQDLFLVNRRYPELPYVGDVQGAYGCDEERYIINLLYP